MLTKKRVKQLGPWSEYTVDKVVDKLFVIDGLTMFAKLLILLELRQKLCSS